MNKQLILALIGPMLAFTACQTETPEPKEDNDEIRIEGSWNFVSLNQNDGVLTLDDYPYATFTSQSENESGQLKLENDDTYNLQVSFDERQEINSANGAETKLNQDLVQQENDFYIFDEDNSVLTLKTAQGPMVFDVVKLTANTMELKREFNYQYYDNDIDRTYKTRSIMVYNFAR